MKFQNRGFEGIRRELLMPDYVRTANAAVARLQIMTQIKCGEMRFNEDKPEEPGD